MNPCELTTVLYEQCAASEFKTWRKQANKLKFESQYFRYNININKSFFDQL